MSTHAATTAPALVSIAVKTPLRAPVAVDALDAAASSIMVCTYTMHACIGHACSLRLNRELVC